MAKQTIQLKDLTAGAQYAVQVRSIGGGSDTLTSNWSLTYNITTDSDTEPPSDPASIQAVGTIKNITVTWNPVPESDLAYYQLYASQSSMAGDPVLNGTKVYEGNGSGFAHSVGDVETWYYQVRGVDTTMNAGSFSPEVSATTTDPGEYGNFYYDPSGTPYTLQLVGSLGITTGSVDVANGDITTIGGNIIVGETGADTGVIKSNNFVVDTSGFQLDSSGLLQAVDAKIKGEIQATDGYLQNMNITGVLDMVGSGLIRTASSGSRVEIDSDGISFYDTDGTTEVIRMDTSTGNAIFAGEITATSGTIAGDLVIDGGSIKADAGGSLTGDTSETGLSFDSSSGDWDIRGDTSNVIWGTTADTLYFATTTTPTNGIALISASALDGVGNHHISARQHNLNTPSYSGGPVGIAMHVHFGTGGNIDEGVLLSFDVSDTHTDDTVDVSLEVYSGGVATNRLIGSYADDAVYTVALMDKIVEVYRNYKLIYWNEVEYVIEPTRYSGMFIDNSSGVAGSLWAAFEYYTADSETTGFDYKLLATSQIEVKETGRIDVGSDGTTLDLPSFSIYPNGNLKLTSQARGHVHDAVKDYTYVSPGNITMEGYLDDRLEINSGKIRFNEGFIQRFEGAAGINGVEGIILGGRDETFTYEYGTVNADRSELILTETEGVFQYRSYTDGWTGSGLVKVDFNEVYITSGAGGQVHIDTGGDVNIDSTNFNVTAFGGDVTGVSILEATSKIMLPTLADSIQFEQNPAVPSGGSSVLRTLNNPPDDSPILQVESSGGAIRLDVNHGAKRLSVKTTGLEVDGKNIHKAVAGIVQATSSTSVSSGTWTALPTSTSGTLTGGTSRSSSGLSIPATSEPGWYYISATVRADVAAGTRSLLRFTNLGTLAVRQDNHAPYTASYYTLSTVAYLTSDVVVGVEIFLAASGTAQLQRLAVSRTSPVAV